MMQHVSWSIIILFVGLLSGPAFAQQQQAIPQQPPPQQVDPQPSQNLQIARPRPAPFASSASNSPRLAPPRLNRLSSIPFMLGDLLRASRNLSFAYNLAGDVAGTPANGTILFRNAKVAENNTALPRDRVSVRYHWFHNGASVTGLELADFGRGAVISALDVGLQGLPPGVTLPSAAQLLPPDPNLGQFVFALPNDQLGQLATAFPPDGNGVIFDPGSQTQGTRVRPSRNAALTGDPNVSFFNLERFLRNRNVRSATRDYDVQLVNFGFEQTFLDGDMSLEVRMPFVRSVNSDLDLVSSLEVNDPFTRSFLVSPFDGTLGSADTELKDIQLILKGLIHSTNEFAFTTGLSTTIPTAEDVNVRIVDGFPDPTFRVSPIGVIPLADVLRQRDVTVENQTVALSPFLALAATPNDRMFINAFLQWDFPIGRDSVTVLQTNRARFVNINNTAREAFVSTSELKGDVSDQILMHLDVGGGYWLTRNPRSRFLKGWAAFVELHWTSTLQDADIFEAPSTFLGTPVLLPKRILAAVPEPVVSEPALKVGNTSNRMDIVNATVGNMLVIGERTTLALGAGLPLRSGTDKTFDFEVQAQLNYYFGAQSPYATPQ